MNDPEIPATRAEAYEDGILLPAGEVSVLEAPRDFLTLGVRRVLYVVGLAGAVAAPVLAVTHPDYAAAIVTASGLLTASALGTALANPTR